MTESTAYTKWVWRHIEVALPSDWEMLQFSREKPQGRCAFADHYQFRFELDWCEVEKEPDLNRLTSDYKAKMLNEKNIEDATSSKIAGWPGLIGRTNGQWMSRYALYFPEGKCLLEVVFIWTDQREKDIEKRVLQSLTYHGDDANAAQRWTCFGMDLLAPPEHTLEECTVQPALAQLTFTGSKKPERFRAKRLGMVQDWFDRPLEVWLNEQADPFVTDATVSTEQVSGIQVAVMRGTYKTKGVLHANGHYSSACWINEQDGRIYFVEMVKRNAPATLKELLQRCSDQNTLTLGRS